MCADYETPEFYRETSYVARKRHACVECPFPILPGQRYVKIVGKWDDISVVKMHPECQHLAEVLGSLFCDGSWAFGGMAEHLAYAGIPYDQDDDEEDDYFMRLKCDSDDVEPIRYLWERIQQRYSGIMPPEIELGGES